jgi:DNA (cytosine-5)-methyltransferase 1
MIHGSLFSGIGGFDLAAEWMGWTNAFHCEWEEFPRKILQYHFPESKSYGDINETDFTIWNGKIDILTGGFPCQPYSAAGKRLGKEDERHLWPQMLRAIREIEPRWIIGENVYGLVSWNDGMVFEEVQVDLENEGYEVQPYILPAAAVNAPHRRDRVWFVAYSDRIGHHRDTEENGHDTSDKYRRILQGERHDRHEVWGETQRRGAVATNTRNHSDRLQTERGLGMDGQLLERREWGKEANRLGDNSQDDNATNTDKVRLQFSEDTRKVRAGQSQVCGARSEFADAIKADGEKWNATNTNSRRLERSIKERWDSEYVERKSEFGDATNTQVTRSEGQRIEGQGQVQFNGRGVEVTRSRWDKFPTQPPVCGRDDGIPRELDSITFPKWRNESIKAYGNAIVPQVAYQLFKTIEKYEEMY